MPWVACFQTGIAVALGVIAFRAFPVLAAFVVGPARSTAQRLGAVALYTLAAYFAVECSDFRAHQLLVAYLYLGAASLAAYLLPWRIPQLLSLTLLCGLFLVLPGRLVGGEPPVIVLGWELVLCVHSYCRHVPRPARTLRDYWFFLFVDPTLAHPCRGARVADAAVYWPGLARAAQGAAALCVSGFAYAMAPAVGALPLGVVSPVVDLVVRLVALYAAHSGLASLQIGLFRQLGYVAPERYLRPYRARSLRDFWARWNTYVGDWVRLYVFEPSVRALAKWPRARRWPRTALHGLALSTSFIVVGILHDVYSSVVRREFVITMTLWFTANAVVLVLWDATALHRRRRTGTWIPRLVAPALAVCVMAGLAVALP